MSEQEREETSVLEIEQSTEIIEEKPSDAEDVSPTEEIARDEDAEMIENAESEEETEDIPVDETEENKKILRKLRFQHIIDINMVRVFFAVLIAVMTIAVIPGIRPDYSDVEKRELTKFPKPTFSSVFSGKFFDDISLWYSDTFPMRERLVKLNGIISGLFGKNDVAVHGDVDEGDDIPDIDEALPSEPEPVAPVEPEVPKPIVEQLGALLIVDNTAYEYYNFNRTASDAYSAYVSKAADMLSGKATVYDLIIPTSIAITAPEDIAAKVTSSDQKKAIEYMNARMSANVKKVECFDVLKAHKDEYIYFRTDHHWTAHGAYYAYKELMAAKGAAPAELSVFTEHKFEGFLGTFYAGSGQNTRLGATPDTVFAYAPTQMAKISTVTEAGQHRQLSIISDGNVLSASNKYLSFICGDHPYGHISNPQIAENTACIVIKESFGNALVPFLTQNYKNVYVVDYRYFHKIDARKLSKLVEDTAAQDIIFINNISATRNPNLVNALGSFIG